MAINSADKVNKQIVYTGSSALLSIRGKTKFTSDMGGTQPLGLYVNVQMPSDRTKREALARGGWTAWFEYNTGNVTGLMGPVPFSLWSPHSMLITHTWRHGVSKGQKWAFGIRLEAYDSKGKPIKFPVTLTTRNVRLG